MTTYDERTAMIMARAIKECDLDCSSWGEDSIMELAFIILHALQDAGRI